jgi:ATP-dependent exoDNAse (exonuclease V) beta subunit
MASSGALPADQAQRLRALDVERSYIVQAPAGSGKTGLLTQRYLALLATVEQPEEIVAITFTRKAAGEMRSRVLEALRGSREQPPDEPYERLTWELAGHALARSVELSWNLLENPQRLRIRTIDSLCQFIARQMPVQSGFGEIPAVAEDARHLYRAAAESVVAELASPSSVADALARLLVPLDNDPDALARLVADMLARRDQWLRHIVTSGSRAEIERVLERVVEDHLSELAAAFPDSLAANAARLAAYAAANLSPDHPLSLCAGWRALPSADAGRLSEWRALAGLLLTKTGDWRRSLDRRSGFPPASKGLAKDMKEAMGELLKALRSEEPLRQLLNEVNSLPDPFYSDGDWQLIEALLEALLAAVAHLRVIFSEQGAADFTEIALSAQTALGGALEPTELALRLDYRLQHLLVDEFQDTSQNQHELFQRLTAGWQPGDGRTLFLVGDPMQSIYGFREADVGLFLDAWQGRLGNIALEPLRLTVNFRSDHGVVDWLNRTFPAVFPARDDKEKGAVSYAASEAFRRPAGGPAVHVHEFLGRDDAAEAERVAELVREGSQRAGETTAILARSRSHLAAIVERLRAAGLRFRAVEIGELKDRPAVMDLVSLTLALLHLGDRVSWLSVLHGPYCGLSLADLLLLAGSSPEDRDRCLPELLLDEQRAESLSEDGRQRLARVGPVFRDALAERGARPLAAWVESAWLGLGGPATLSGEAAVEDAEVFFELLQRIEATGQAVTPELIQEAVESLCALPDPLADERLQLMTIHKAKGLEFDTVIVPGLGRRPRGDSGKLLYWLERTGVDGEPELFFGPLRSKSAGKDSPTSAYIRNLEAEIARLESGRLLYVAATRARQGLHLLGHAKLHSDGRIAPDRGSLLEQLWPAVGHLWQGGMELREPAGLVPGSPAPIMRTAIAADWQPPAPPAGLVESRGEATQNAEPIPFEWAGDTARAVGTVVHRLLQHFADAPGDSPPKGPPRETLSRMLLREGVLAGELSDARGRVEAAVESALRDPRGQWILSTGHDEAACELPVSAVVDGQVRRLVIDRTFIDEQGARWVIDYKTGVHAGGSIETFLDQEAERYHDQLAGYAEAFRKLEDRPVRAALYFPLIEAGWRELDV